VSFGKGAKVRKLAAAANAASLAAPERNKVSHKFHCFFFGESGSKWMCG
jgi:hypothetical protein